MLVAISGNFFDDDYFTLDLMANYIRDIDWKSFLTAVVVWYVFPIIGISVFNAWLVSVYATGETKTLLQLFAGLTVLVWWGIAPIGCGYTIAYFAKRLPQMTALLALTVGYFLHSANQQLGLLGLALWALFNFGGGALGFHLWQRRARRRS